MGHKYIPLTHPPMPSLRTMKMTRMRTTATTSDAAQKKQTAKMTRRRTRRERERERPQRLWCCTARRWWRTSSAWASPLTGRICYATLGHVDGAFNCMTAVKLSYMWSHPVRQPTHPPSHRRLQAPTTHLPDCSPTHPPIHPLTHCSYT